MDTSILDLLFDLKMLIGSSDNKIVLNIALNFFTLLLLQIQQLHLFYPSYSNQGFFFFIINLFQRYIFFTTYGYISFLCFLLTNYQDISFNCVIVFYGLLSQIDTALQEGVEVLKLLLSKGLTESARHFNTIQKYKHIRLQNMPA